jgi:hypothetical protein
MGNKYTHLAAVNNQTPFTFDFEATEQQEHRYLLHPGRTWLTRSGNGDDMPTVPDYNSGKAIEHAFQFNVVDDGGDGSARDKTFYLCKGESFSLLYFDVLTRKNPKKLLLKVEIGDSIPWQLNILGTTFDGLRFGVQPNEFPTWDRHIGVAGIMNNWNYNVTVTTARCKESSKPSYHSYTIKSGGYGDFGTKEATVKDFEPQQPPKETCPSGLLIPQLDSLLPFGAIESHDYFNITLASSTLPMCAQYFHLMQTGAGLFYMDHSEYKWKLIPGGHSQADSPLKYLEITSNYKLRMVDRPSDLSIFSSDGHALGPHADLLLTMDTDLLHNHREKASNKNETEEYFSFVTRIRLTDRKRRPHIQLPLLLSVTPATSVTIRGKEFKTSDFSGKKFVEVETDGDGVVTLTQPVNKDLGSAIIHFKTKGKTPISNNIASFDIHSGDKVSTVLQNLKTKHDWMEARDRSGTKLFTKFDERMVAQFKDIIGMTAVPRTINPILLPGNDGNKDPHEVTDPIITNVARSPREGEAPLPQLRRKEAFNDAPDSIPLVPLYRPSVAHLPTNHVIYFDFDKGKIHSGEKARVKLDKVKSRSLKNSKSSSNKADGVAANGSIQTKSAWDALCAWAKDSWRLFIKPIIEVVGNAVKLFIADVEYLIETVADILMTIGAIFAKMLEVAFESVVEWLGSVLDWDAIKGAYNVVYSIGESTADALVYGAQIAADYVREVLDLPELQKKLDEASKNPLLSQSPTNSANNTASDDPTASTVTSASKSPSFHWGNDTLANHQDKFGNLGSLKLEAELKEQTKRDLEAALATPGQTVTDTLKEIWKQWDDLTILQIAKKLFNSILQAAKQMVSGLLQVLVDLVSALKSILKGLFAIPLEVPILAPLWRKHIAPSGTTRSPNMLEVTSLLTAIPVAYAAKLFSYMMDIDYIFGSDFKIPNWQSYLKPSQPTNNSSSAHSEFSGVTDFASSINMGASSSDTPGTSPGPPKSRDTLISAGLSLVGCVLQTLSIVWYGLLEMEKIFGEKIPNRRAFKAIVYAMRTPTDCLGYTISLASACIAYNGAKNTDSKPRRILEIVYTGLSIFVRVKDIAKMYNAWQDAFNPSTDPHLMWNVTNMQWAIVECFAGGFQMVSAVGIIIAHKTESQSNTTPRAVLPLRFTALILASCSTMLALPREVLEMERKSQIPGAATEEGYCVIARVLLQTVTNLANYSTAVINLVNNANDNIVVP